MGFGGEKFLEALAEGFGGDGLREKRRAVQAIDIGGDVVGGTENGAEAGEVGLDRVAKRESIGRGEVDLADQEVATAVGIDPFDGGVGGFGDAWLGPTEVGEDLRDRLGDGFFKKGDEDFHGVWLVR